MPTQKRILEIDGLRGIAVIAVLLWHFTGSMVNNDGSLLSKVIISATVFGRTGVDLFFVLSGFLIIGILIDNRSSTNLFRVFYLRRFLRIWPPYAVLLVVYWLCYLWLGESDAFNTRYGFWVQFIAQITFTYNLLMAVADGALARGLSVVWSVSIEEWFYIVFPIMIVKIHRRHLVKFLICVGLLSASCRMGIHLLYPKLWQAPYVLMPLRLDGLCAGGLVAVAVRSDKAMKLISENRARLLRLSVLAVAAGAASVISVRGHLDSNMYIWGHLCLALAYGALVLAVVTSVGDDAVAVLRSRFLREAGRYSYTLYLIHPLFISLFFQVAGRREVVMAWQDFWLCAGALGSAIAFSVASYWLMERRLVKFGHQFEYLPAGATIGVTENRVRAI
jgi:peptidoglycan/LPS O-acetylase OafA/YrhL